MNRAYKEVHQALKEQARIDLEAFKSRYPTEEEIAAAPPPTPEATAELEAGLEKFRLENEARKAARERAEVDDSFEELFRRPKPARRVYKRAFISVAACVGVLLGSYTAACAYTASTTGKSFVNVFCDGYVFVKPADDPDAMVDPNYQNAVDNFKHIHAGDEYYMPEWMIPGYLPADFNVEESVIELIFRIGKKNKNPIELCAIKHSTASFDFEVDRYKVKEQDSREYVYTEKSSPEGIIQKVRWNYDEDSLYIQHIAVTANDLLVDDDLLKIAMSTKHHKLASIR